MARNNLGEALLRVTRPSLRLECPLPPVLIGRDRLLQQCAVDLLHSRSLTFSGQAGIGKTSLGAYLAQQWPSGAAFWHTFRPGLNDDLASVVFGLAHFLHQHGCSSLWLQLMANETILDNLEQVIGFLREDLAYAANLPVLLSFDEIDLLHTLAEAYFETGQLELAEKSAMRAVQSENPRIQPYACYTLGQIRHKQNRVSDAEHVFQTGLHADAQSGDDFIAACLHRAYGEVLYQENRFAEGTAQLEEARDLFA